MVGRRGGCLAYGCELGRRSARRDPVGPIPRSQCRAHARAFVIRLRRFSRRPKTVDAYARNLARYLAWFDEVPAARWLEADEGDLLAYLDDLRNGRVPGISAGLKRALLRTWSRFPVRVSLRRPSPNMWSHSVS